MSLLGLCQYSALAFDTNPYLYCDGKADMSEETDNIAVEENVDKHLQKGLDAEEENKNTIEMFRSKVREKLKNAKINQSEKSSTHLLIDNKINQWSKVNPQTEVSLEADLSFFTLNGEEGTALGQFSEQRLVNDSYPKHLSLGDNVQDFAESHDKDYMEEVIFPDLLEVKAAEYEDDQEQIKRQQINIFVPSSSSGKGMCWFEESAEIMSLPSPISQSWKFRLNISKESLNPALKTIYRKAVKSDLESSIRTKMEGQGKMYQLDLNIVGLQFSHHPVFNQEQVLCARLLQLYECFQDRQQQNLSQLLLEKLKALTHATKLLNDDLEMSQLTGKSLQDYYWQIRKGKGLLPTTKYITYLETDKISSTTARVYKHPDKVTVSESLLYLALELEETDIEGIKPITLMPQLSFAEELTNLSKCSLHEQKRRAKIQKLKYFIKILYNDKQVSCTSISPLQFDFKVMFQQIFNIQLIYWPETICLEVYEINKRTNLLAKLYVPLPNNTELKSKTALEYVEFSSDELVMPEYGEVGSNVPFLLEGNETEELCLFTSGKLSYSLSWALDENGIPLTPMSQSLRSAYCR
ncbi:PREDICTED: uncharacterized protein C10orf131 homolog [Myotis brandtii]|uniref:uncharacterized protein C10orf131 homolog n=1 Tax=Myotis brandtii TaxID=109478 RepID=UPI00070423FC|nr:PREDICTED: uncharacterized protein C10orf131 homolog [Myotis brandtii]